jgi:hypothetical protein
LIQACRSDRSLQWDNDYLIREVKYFQFRTKLQEKFPNVQQRLERVAKWHHLCQMLMKEISKLVDIAGQFEQKLAEPSLQLLDLYRRFDEDCIQLLAFKGTLYEEPITKERIQNLYYILKDKTRFEGEAREAYEVLKEYLRRIHDTLHAFTPEALDTDDVRSYKANLRKWLDLDAED